MRYLAAALIRLYQKFSRLTPAVCRFYPTCSCYAQTAILRFGVLRGGFLALRRLLHTVTRGIPAVSITFRNIWIRRGKSSGGMCGQYDTTERVKQFYE